MSNLKEIENNLFNKDIDKDISKPIEDIFQSGINQSIRILKKELEKTIF